MKKTLYFLLIIFPLFSQAQFEFGFKGGLDVNKFVSSKQDFVSENIKPGLTGGIFVRFQNKNFYLQPEVNFTSKNGDYSYSSLTSGNHDTIFLNKIGYIDVVVLLGIRITKHIRIGSGPVVSILNSDKEFYQVKSSGITFDIVNSDFNSLNLSWQTGIAIDILHFCFDVRYEYGLSHAVGSFKLPNSNIEISPEARNSLWQFTVGIKF